MRGARKSTPPFSAAGRGCCLCPLSSSSVLSCSAKGRNEARKQLICLSPLLSASSLPPFFSIVALPPSFIPSSMRFTAVNLYKHKVVPLAFSSFWGVQSWKVGKFCSTIRRFFVCFPPSLLRAYRTEELSGNPPPTPSGLLLRLCFFHFSSWVSPPSLSSPPLFPGEFMMAKGEKLLFGLFLLFLLLLQQAASVPTRGKKKLLDIARGERRGRYKKELDH